MTAVASTAMGPSTRCGIIGGDKARLWCSSVREKAVGTVGIVSAKLVTPTPVLMLWNKDQVHKEIVKGSQF